MWTVLNWMTNSMDHYHVDVANCSTTSSRRAEMMKHVDPSLVHPSTCSQRDEVIFLFLYHFPTWIYWLCYIPFSEWGELGEGGGGASCGLEEDLGTVELEDSSDGRGQNSEEEDKEEERHEKRGGGAWGWCGAIRRGVGVMGLLRDLHPHADLGVPTSFTLL
jgi:hypothetical protein